MMMMIVFIKAINRQTAVDTMQTRVRMNIILFTYIFAVLLPKVGEWAWRM